MNVLQRRLGYMLTPQNEIYKNIAPLVKDKSVLEVGFGSGMGVVQYAGDAQRVIGIELDQDAVDFANWILPLKNVSWERGDICAEVLGKYDVIVMLEVIEHIPRWHEALEKCRNLLLPKGKLIISTPNANGTFMKNPLHGDEWTAKEFKDRLKNYFEDVKLYDFSLKEEKTTNTRITPLVAICG